MAYEIWGNIRQLRYQGHDSNVKCFPCKHKDLCLILIIHVEALPITDCVPIIQTLRQRQVDPSDLLASQSSGTQWVPASVRDLVSNNIRWRVRRTHDQPLVSTCTGEHAWIKASAHETQNQKPVTPESLRQEDSQFKSLGYTIQQDLVSA